MQAADAGDRFRVWPAVRYLIIMRTFWVLTLATGAPRPAMGALGIICCVSGVMQAPQDCRNSSCTAGRAGACSADCGACRAPPNLRPPLTHASPAAPSPGLAPSFDGSACGGQACAGWRRT